MYNTDVLSMLFAIIDYLESFFIAEPVLVKTEEWVCNATRRYFVFIIKDFLKEVDSYFNFWPVDFH